MQWIIKPTAQAGTSNLRVIGMGGALRCAAWRSLSAHFFLDQMAEFFVEFSQVFAGFRERPLVQEPVAAPEVASCWCAARSRCRSTRRFTSMSGFWRSQMSIGACVVNRVHSAGPALSVGALPLRLA